MKTCPACENDYGNEMFAGCRHGLCKLCSGFTNKDRRRTESKHDRPRITKTEDELMTDTTRVSYRDFKKDKEPVFTTVIFKSKV